MCVCVCACACVCVLESVCVRERVFRRATNVRAEQRDIAIEVRTDSKTESKRRDDVDEALTPHDVLVIARRPSVTKVHTL